MGWASLSWIDGEEERLDRWGKREDKEDGLVEQRGRSCVTKEEVVFNGGQFWNFNLLIYTVRLI